MLYKVQKVFKPVYKKYITGIAVLFFLFAFTAGCSNTKEEIKKEMPPAATTAGQAGDKLQAEKKAYKTENVKKLSEIYNWDNARITTDYYYPDFGEGQVLQNQDYIFYPEDGNKIVRISKSDGSKKIIYKHNAIKDVYIHYCLADNGLFIEYNANIYFCGFDGENQKTILPRKKLRKKLSYVYNIYFYKDKLYLI